MAAGKRVMSWFATINSKGFTKGIKDMNKNFKEFEKTTSKGQSQISKNFKSILAGLTGVGALAGVWFIAAKGMRGALREMAKAEQTSVKLDAILRSTGHAAGMTRQAVDEVAASFGKMSTFARQDVREASTILLTFTKITEDHFAPTMEQALNMSAVFGQTLQQSMIQLGTALNDPIAGVGRLMRIGISFSAEQRKSIKLFMQQNDVMSAQAVILDELQREIGGTALALAETFSGRFTQIINNVGELWGNLAGLVTLNPDLMDAMGDLKTKLDELLDLDLQTAFVQWKIDFLEGFVSMLSALETAFPGLTTAVHVVLAAMQTLGTTMFKTLSNAWVDLTLWFQENSMEDTFDVMLFNMKDLVIQFMIDIGVIMVEGFATIAEEISDDFFEIFTRKEGGTTPADLGAAFVTQQLPVLQPLIPGAARGQATIQKGADTITDSIFKTIESLSMGFGAATGLGPHGYMHVLGLKPQDIAAGGPRGTGFNVGATEQVTGVDISDSAAAATRRGLETFFQEFLGVAPTGKKKAFPILEKATFELTSTFEDVLKEMQDKFPSLTTGLEGTLATLRAEIAALKENTAAVEDLSGNVDEKIGSLTLTLKNLEDELRDFSTSLGAGLAEGGSVRDLVGDMMQKVFTEHFTGRIAESFGEGHSLGGFGGGLMEAILPGLGGGLIGGLIGGLFRKKPKDIKKPIPVKVVNWGDMTQQLLKASTRRAVSPMITTSGNSIMSANFSREARI